MAFLKKWKWVILVAVLVPVAAGTWWHSRASTKYRQAEVTRGDIISVINTTGTVSPLKSIPIGAMVSGTVAKVHVTYNSDVKKGQVLAEIDSQPNADYSKVISPVEGVVIERKVEEGQSVREGQSDLFLVAPDLRKEILIYASIDEADIGLIRKAKLDGQPVEFTVEAYPVDKFPGKIQDVRINPTVQQNVVSYHVVVGAPNPELKLLPGMTAKLSFQIDKRTDVIQIPSAALRFYPKVRYVHPDDRHILEGTTDEVKPETQDATVDDRSAAQRVGDRQQESRRHVWYLDGDLLRAVQVTTGLNDNTHTEMTSGKLSVGQKLVTGMR